MKFSMPIGDERIKIDVIGAGGTGSALLSSLTQLSMALTQLGHVGIDVRVWDDDVVSQANIGRQLFAPSDVGRAKVEVLVNRINLGLGLSWSAVPMRFDGRAKLGDIVIGCVDSRGARALLAEQFRKARNQVWIDCGNSQYSGQVLFGARRNGDTVVPSVADLFPEVVDVIGDAKDDQPSCSVAEALAKQDLMINRFMADTATHLLFQLLRKGELQEQGAFIHLQPLSMVSIPLDPEYWARSGWIPSTS